MPLRPLFYTSWMVDQALVRLGKSPGRSMMSCFLNYSNFTYFYSFYLFQTDILDRPRPSHDLNLLYFKSCPNYIFLYSRSDLPLHHGIS